MRASRLLESTIFASLLAIIALSAIPYGTVEPWWEALFECAVFTLGLLWVVEGLLSSSWQLSGYRLLMPLFALAIFAFLQTQPLLRGTEAEGIRGRGWRAVSADPYETRLFIYYLLSLCLALGLLRRYTSNRHRLRALIHLVIGVGVASALFGMVRQMTQVNPWRLTWPGERSGLALMDLAPDVGYGQFINRNHFAYLMEMTLGLVLGIVVCGGLRRGRRTRLILYSVAAVPVWIALVLANSRGGLFGMLGLLIFIGLLFTLLPPWRASRAKSSGRLSGWWGNTSTSLITRAALVSCLVIVVCAGVIWVGGDQLMGRLESLPKQLSVGGTGSRELWLESEHRAVVPRIEIWRATWRLIKAHPFAGVGMGGYGAAITQYFDASGEWTLKQAHNDYLELFASGGLFGCALGAWFIASFVRMAQERLRLADSFRLSASCGALAGLFGAAIHSFVDFGLHITANALIFTALVAIATAQIGSSEQRAGREAEGPAPARPHHP